jgi:hypothetical protein
MPIGFLVPIFLGGLALIAIPIWIHLTRKQRSLVVPFPSLMFLRQIPFKEDRRRTIHHWFLLALRALALALLALAFARPFLDQSDLGAGGSAGPREVVVLIDQSYSMALDGKMDDAVAEPGRARPGALDSRPAPPARRARHGPRRVRADALRSSAQGGADDRRGVDPAERRGRPAQRLPALRMDGRRGGPHTGRVGRETCPAGK